MSKGKAKAIVRAEQLRSPIWTPAWRMKISLEKGATLVPAVAAGIEWGNLAGVRDKLLRLAGHQGSAAVRNSGANWTNSVPLGFGAKQFGSICRSTGLSSLRRRVSLKRWRGLDLYFQSAEENGAA